MGCMLSKPVAVAPPPPADPAAAPASAGTVAVAAASAADEEQAFLDLEELDGEEDLPEDVFSDEEEEFGKVEEDNKDGVEDGGELVFGMEDVEGENFMSVKPWIGAIKEPSEWKAPDDLGTMPDQQLRLTRVNGYRCRAVYNNIHYGSTGELIYPAAAVVVMRNDANAQRFYQRHVDDVLCLALSPDKTVAASGGKATISDRGRSVHPSLHIWNVETGENIAIVRRQHKRAIVCACFSPDGRYVVSVGLDNDHTMMLHDASTGNRVAMVETGTDKVIGVGWNAKTGYITCVGVKTVSFYKFNGSTFGRRRRGLVGRIGKRQTNLSVAFPSNGRTWTGTYSGGIYMWSGNKLVKELKGHTGRVNALHAGPGYMVSGDSKGNILVWNESGNCLGQTSVNGQVRALCVGPDGRLAVGTSRGEVLNIALDINDVASASPTIVQAGHFAGETWALCCDKDGTRAFTGGDDNMVCLWDLVGNTRLASAIIAEKAVKATSRHGQRSTMSKCAPNQCCRTADWGPAGTIAYGTNDGRVVIIDENTLETIRETRVTERPIAVVKFDPTGDYLAIGAHDSQAYVYTTQDLSKVSTCTGNSSWVSHIDWDESGIAIQTCSGAYELLFYTAETGEQQTNGATLFRDEPWNTFTSTLGWPVKGIWPAFSKGSDINTVDRAADQSLLAVGDDRGRIRLFRYPCLDRGSACRTERGHASHLTKLRFTADVSKLLSIGGNDNTLLVWDVVA